MKTKVIEPFWRSKSGDIEILKGSYLALKGRDLQKVNSILFEEGIIKFQRENKLNLDLLKSGNS